MHPGLFSLHVHVSVKQQVVSMQEMEAAMDWRPSMTKMGIQGGLIGRMGGEAERRNRQEEEPFEGGGMGNGGERRAGGDEDDGERREIVEEQPAPYVDCYADWRVLSQTVVITQLDLVTRSFSLFTQLAVLPLDANLTYITLHVGRNCLFPSEYTRSDGRVTVNGEEARYERIHSFEGLSSECREKSMSEFSRVYGKRASKYEGDVRIYIPSSAISTVRQLRCVTVAMDAHIQNPIYGIQFNAVVGQDGQLERGAHAFTHRSNLMSSTHEWLPCLDAPDQLCLWTLHITCDASMTAIASAELTDVELSVDLREKTFHYQQLIPTAATNMGWTVGQYTTHVHKEMHEVTNFALPGLSSLVEHTTCTLDRTLEYFEELLSCRYPYPSYKQVFVDKLSEDVTCFASFSLVSVNILYHKKIIDVVQPSRHILALAVAQQFFGCFISGAEFSDLWVVRSLARYLTWLFVDKVFGRCEHLYQTKCLLTQVCDYESVWGKLVLRPSSSSVSEWHSDPSSSITCSPLYADALFKKGVLVMRMLSKRLGQEPFFQVLHKLLRVGEQMGKGKREQPTCWTYLVVSTEAFFRTVHAVTGQEIPTFLEQFVYGGGHANFNVNFTFNRKRNMIELDMKQEEAGGKGVMSYTGPLTIVVQELDGCFNHTVQIDSDISRHELQCHSKGRRQKKKKVPMSTGEEVDVDLSNMDPDSPVLWIRVDPDMLILRSLRVRQPPYQWEYLLKYERDSLAQMTAVERIQQFPSATSRVALVETINNEQFFYRVRCRAAFALTAVHNKMAEVVTGRPALLTLFEEKFGCKSAPHIPRSNSYVATSTNLQTYFLMQAIPSAVGRMRSKWNAALTEAHNFLRCLLYYNDNSTNRYSDDHYRATLLSALSSTIITGETLGGGDSSNPSSMATDVSSTLRELTLALNMDTLRPSFGRVVGVSALLGIFQMMNNGFIPHDSVLFWKFAHPNVFVQLRKAALWVLVDRLRTLRGPQSLSLHEDFSKLLNMAQNDPHPAIRHYILELLAKHAPFEAVQCGEMGSHIPLNTQVIADQLWTILTAPRTDAHLRSLVMDVWLCMYGWSLPPSLGGREGGGVKDGRIHAPTKRRQEGRPPTPLIGWHSSDFRLEREDDNMVSFDEALNEETLQ